MRITNRGRYALRASLALARLGQHGSPVSIAQLSEEEHISPVFLEQIFFKLRRAEIVQSVRGPGGGFRFAKNLDVLTLKDILSAAGEELNVTDCDKNAKACEKTGIRCLSHTIWEDITKLLNDYFTRVTLAAALKRGKPG